jgi:hypothetical protein
MITESTPFSGQKRQQMLIKEEQILPLSSPAGRSISYSDQQDS